MGIFVGALIAPSDLVRDAVPFYFRLFFVYGVVGVEYTRRSDRGRLHRAQPGGHQLIPSPLPSWCCLGNYHN